VYVHPLFVIQKARKTSGDNQHKEGKKETGKKDMPRDKKNNTGKDTTQPKHSYTLGMVSKVNNVKNMEQLVEKN
jgi:hypothetical protein